MFRFKFFKKIVWWLMFFSAAAGGCAVLNEGACADEVVAENGVNSETLEIYRSRLLQYFKLIHGRDVNFGRQNEADKLYEAIKKFEQEAADVAAENFIPYIADFVKSSRKDDCSYEVLDRNQFEEIMKNSSNLLRLFATDLFFRRSKVDQLKKGEILTRVKQIQNNKMADYLDDNLKTTSCKEIADHSHEFVGPWLFWACDEIAIDLDKTLILDSEVLDEIVTIMKYDHPEDIGFVKEITDNFNEERSRKKYENFEDRKWADQFFLDGYFYVPYQMSNCISVFIDKLYREKAGVSYFDVEFERLDKNKINEIENKMKAFEGEIEAYRNSMGVPTTTTNEEDFDIRSKVFYVNKTLEILKNEELLTKLLGYDVLFSKYNVTEGEISLLNIAPNPRNGDYKIVNYDKIAFICSDERFKERDNNYDIINQQG